MDGVKTAVLVNRVLAAIWPVFADRRGTDVAGLDASIHATTLAVAGLRSQGSGERQPRVPALAVTVVQQPERPFFAFLNYSDAHTPYELSPGGFTALASRL